MKPKIKLFFLVIFPTLLLILRNLVYIIPFFVGISFLALYLMLKHKLRLYNWLKFILPICLLIILLQSFTYAGLGFSFEGLNFGLLVSLRLLTILLAVFIFISTTPYKELVESLSFLPPKVTSILTLSLSLLPKIEDIIVNVVNAQKVRGVNFKSPNFLKTYPPLLIPIFTKTLEKAEQLSLALQARGSR